MKTLLILISLLILSGTADAKDSDILKTQKDKLSYGIGMDIGNSLKAQAIDIDPDTLTRGVKDVLSGKKLLMTDQELADTMETLKNELMAKQMEKMKEIGENNKKEGAEFLAKNSKNEGVTVLPSGLQYRIMNEGAGDKPKATDTVTVNYRGTLIDGTEFDSSYKRNQPATFPVNGVIAGWTEALQLMNTGAKWQLFIPSELAYGERGAGQQIGPNSTLIFDVELISIEKSK